MTFKIYLLDAFCQNFSLFDRLKQKLCFFLFRNCIKFVVFFIKKSKQIHCGGGYSDIDQILTYDSNTFARLWQTIQPMIRRVRQYSIHLNLIRHTDVSFCRCYINHLK